MKNKNPVSSIQHPASRTHFWPQLIRIGHNDRYGGIPCLSNQRGVALITAILFLTILSLSWASFYMFGRYEEGMIQNEIRSDQAAYLAETGVQEALWRLSQDYDWENWGSDSPSSLWSGSHGSDADGSYYEWSGNLGDAGNSYAVKIRDNGEVENKVVSTGSVGSFNRAIEVEIGSAFDYGLYSHDELEFRTRSFTVSGADSTGYVYAKDAINDLSGFLRANKITGNFTGGPGTFYYFPKAIPLPELWTPNLASAIAPGFEASIRGTPSPTTVGYDNDTGEGNLQTGDLLHNKERGNFRTIQSFNTGTNTLITEPPPANDNWADNDEIVVERIDQYESQWDTLSQEANGFDNPPAPPPYDHTYRKFKTTINGFLSGTELTYADTNGDSGEESLLGFRAQISNISSQIVTYYNDTREGLLAADLLLYSIDIMGTLDWKKIQFVNTNTNTITLYSSPGWAVNDFIFLHNSSFKAQISSVTPSLGEVTYYNDAREGVLKWLDFHSIHLGEPLGPGERDEGEAILYNITQGGSQKIYEVNTDTNTITLDAVSWAVNDFIEIPLILYNMDQNRFTTINYVDTQNDKIITNTDIITLNPWSVNDEIKADIFLNPGTGTQTFPEGSDAHAEFLADNVSFFGSTTFNQTVKIDGSALFGLHATSGAGETIIAGDLLVDGNAYFFNKVDITNTGRLYVTGKLYMFDNEPAVGITNAYRDNHYYSVEPSDPPDQDWKVYLSYAADGNKLDTDADTYGDFDFDRTDGDGDGDEVDADDIDRYVDVDESLTHGITIAAGGGIFVRDGITTVYEMVQTAPLKIEGYFYTNGSGRAPLGCANCGPPIGVLINHGYPGTWGGKTEIKNGNTDQSAFFVRNGSLQIGTADISFDSDLEGEGRIIVAENVTLSDDLMAPNPNNPLFLAAGGDFYLEDDIASGGFPFYGTVYAGERADIGGSTDSIVTMSRGILTANRFKSPSGSLNPLYGGSIANWDYKSDLYTLGFINDKDYVRPLLWRELK